MDGGDEDAAGAPAGAGKARASPQNFRLVSVSLLLFRCLMCAVEPCTFWLPRTVDQRNFFGRVQCSICQCNRSLAPCQSQRPSPPWMGSLIRMRCCSSWCAAPQKESRRARGSVLSQTVPPSRRGGGGKGGVGLGSPNTYHAGGTAGGTGGGGSSGGGFKSSAREGYLRKILQSRHAFPPHFHMLLFIDR